MPSGATKTFTMGSRPVGACGSVRQRENACWRRSRQNWHFCKKRSLQQKSTETWIRSTAFSTGGGRDRAQVFHGHVQSSRAPTRHARSGKGTTGSKSRVAARTGLWLYCGFPIEMYSAIQPYRKGSCICWRTPQSTRGREMASRKQTARLRRLLRRDQRERRSAPLAELALAWTPPVHSSIRGRVTRGAGAALGRPRALWDVALFANLELRKEKLTNCANKRVAPRVNWSTLWPGAAPAAVWRMAVPAKKGCGSSTCLMLGAGSITNGSGFELASTFHAHTRMDTGSEQAKLRDIF